MTLSTGKYARFTSGSVVAKFGDTSVMSTVVRENVQNTSGIPLSVDYRQKAAAAGRIPTNFFRREIGSSEQEILSSRLIDRSVRPLFAEGYSCKTQIICNLLAVDGLYNPDVLSINAASAALSVSDVPWNGPIGAVRIGLVGDEYVINPTKRELQLSKLNLVVSCASKHLVVMIEGSADNCTEQNLRKAVRLASRECEIIIRSISSLQKQVEKCKMNVTENIETTDDTTIETVREDLKNELIKIFTCYSHDKISRDKAIFDLRKKMLDDLALNKSQITELAAEKCFQKLLKETFRSVIWDTNTR